VKQKHADFDDDEFLDEMMEVICPENSEELE
jgi:hypothetical protein